MNKRDSLFVLDAYQEAQDRIRALEARCKAADELLNRNFPFPYDPVTYGPFYAEWTADRQKWLAGSQAEPPKATHYQVGGPHDIAVATTMTTTETKAEPNSGTFENGPYGVRVETASEPSAADVESDRWAEFNRER